jgi:hypothetical protein
VEITFGSYHETVKTVQQALFDRGHYHGDIDGDFRQRSVTALLAFERANTPASGATGRTTQVIQDLLGIALPAAGKIKLTPMGKLAVAPSPIVVEPAPPRAILVEENDVQDPALVSSVAFTHATEAPTALREDPSLLARIDLNHAPLPGWSIRERGTTKRYDLFHDQMPGGLSLGYQFGYPPANPTTRGLARTSSYSPKLPFAPEDWQADFRSWPELLFPTSWAESNANFLVINAWDSAAMTFGFIQLAAHTPDDLLPFIRRVVAELPEEAKLWFPELTVINRTLCYQRDGRYKSLENARRPDDGGPTSSWYRGDFMQFLNPSRLKTDPEELHAAARWVEWTRTSRDKRKIEVDDSIRNMKDSLVLLHRELLRNASAQYPKGVDGMRCDHLAAALAVPHLSPALIGKAVWALKQSDVLDAFEHLDYGPGDREKSVVEGVRARGTRLSKLRYDLAKDEPV